MRSHWESSEWYIIGLFDRRLELQTDYFIVDAMNEAFREDQTAASHPLTHKIEYQADIEESFDGITYQKVGYSRHFSFRTSGCYCNQHDPEYNGKGQLPERTMGKTYLQQYIDYNRITSRTINIQMLLPKI